MAEKKLDYEFLIEDVWASNTIIQSSNPLGKVPCLIMEGGDAIFDSRVIVEYLDTLSPVGKLIAQPGRERAEVKTWEALADGLLDACILARLEKNWAGRTDSQRSSAWIDRQMDKVDACLSSISMALAERPFFVGNHLSLADIAVGCALAYLDFRFPDISWRTRYENLGPYLEKLLLRPSFIDTNFTS
jgi:glutathione S-transferase